MPTMITYGAELLRINPSNNRIEYSTNAGRTWSTRCTSTSYGTFRDIMQYGNEMLAITSKGIYYSTNNGLTWQSRCTSTSYGEFQLLLDGGNELLANTTKGLYYSTNRGLTWMKRN